MFQEVTKLTIFVDFEKNKDLKKNKHKDFSSVNPQKMCLRDSTA